MADDPLKYVTEASVSCGRKKQLDQYEPINEQVTLTLEFPDDMSADEKRALLNDAEDEAWDEAEQGVADRYEAYVREEAFGN